MKKIFDKKTIYVLLVVIIIGFVLRILYLKNNSLTFIFDQARDAFIVREILNGDLKIQGPSANAPGLYHGVFYFYFLAIPYLLGQGNPVFSQIWLIIFNSLTIICVYVLGFALTKNKKISILSSIFFTVSFEMSQYASWLSNPSMAVWFVPLTYLFLWVWTEKKNKKAAVLTGLFWGLSIQSDLFLVYHAISIFIWLYLNKKTFNKSGIIYLFGGLILGTFSLIVSEIKFGFRGINGLFYLFGGGDTVARSKTIIDFIILYIGQLTKLFTNNLFPTNASFSKLITLIILSWLIISWYKSKEKNKLNFKLFLILFIFSHLPIVPLGGLTAPYLTVGIGVGVCILMGLFIVNLYKKSKIIAVALFLMIMVSNLSKIINENKKGQTIFSVRPQMLLSNLIEAVDYTYKSSNGEKFSIDTITSPLWLNTTWSYLYNWYGFKTYGYLPSWHGRDQVGYWGDNLAKTSDDIKIYYLIIEPTIGIPEIYVKQSIDDENSKSKIIEEKIFDGITIQKREKI